MRAKTKVIDSVVSCPGSASRPSIMLRAERWPLCGLSWTLELYLEATTKAWRLVGDLHPTHRKVRDGWGTRAFWAGGGKAKQKQIPFGDDN